MKSRGLRNRNPGNIRASATRYKGEVRPSRDSAFKEFASMAWGYRAMFVLLHTYRVRHGLNDLEGMIGRWAPPAENRTRDYVRYVADAAGLRPDEEVDTLDETVMLPLVGAMAEIENGVHACTEEVRAGWRLFRADFAG